MTYEVEFQAQSPFKTWFIYFEYPVDEKPIKLIKELELVGWGASDMGIPVVGGIDETEMFKSGSGIFNTWTPEESRKFLAEARKILAAYGNKKVIKHKLAFHEMV